MVLTTIIAYAPALFLRFFANVITVTTVVSVIAATVSMTVVITVVMKPSPGSNNPFYQTVILASMSTFVFNREVKSYELGYYYNATEALYTLVDTLNNHLEQQFPKSFIKFVVSNFSSEPILNFTGMRRRRRRYYKYKKSKKYLCDGISGKSDSLLYNCWPPRRSSHHTSTPSSTGSKPSTTGSSSPTSTGNSELEESSSTTTSETPSYTSDFESTSTARSPISSGISTTALSSNYTSSTTSKNSSTITVAITALQSNSTTNCTISTFNTTQQASLIYIIGTLYFNGTNVNVITVTEIINAMNSFFPSIELINECGKPSSADGSFNSTLSYVQPPSEIIVNVANLNAEDSIPPVLANQINSITPPLITFQSPTTIMLQDTATTPSISSLGTVTPNVGG